MSYPSRPRQTETIMMTKSMYASYEKKAAAAGEDMLAYLRRDLAIPARQPILVVAVDSIKDFPAPMAKEAA
jgi:hypothetical protein